MKAGLGLRCPHIPEDTISHGASIAYKVMCISKNSIHFETFQVFKKVRYEDEFAVEDCHYEIMGDDRNQETFDFYKDSLIADKPVCASLKLPFDEKRVQNCLAKRLSIALISSCTGEIIGILIIGIAKSKDKIDTAKFRSEPLRILFELMKHVLEMCNPFNHYAVEEILENFGLGVHKAYRRKRIATNLMKMAMYFVENLDLGPMVVKGEGTSNFS